MQETTQKNTGNKREKIFAKHAKPHGKSVLAFHIIDALAAATEHLTILQIQKHIRKACGYFFHHDAIMFCINNMHLYCNSISVDAKRLPARRSKAFAFKITINTTIHNEHS